MTVSPAGVVPRVALLATQSDTRLVALTRAGHDRAFEAIARRYRRPMLAVCRRVLPRRRALDALQRALADAWSALARGDDVVELRPWLYRIAYRSALDGLHDASHDYDQLTVYFRDGGEAAQPGHRPAVRGRSRAALAALPGRPRSMLGRAALDSLSHEVIAEELGFSDPPARRLARRLRAAGRATATAIVPLGVADWLARAGSRPTPLPQRLGDLAVGAASTRGVEIAIGKAAAAVVLGGAAVTGGALVDRAQDAQPAAPSGADASAATVRPNRTARAPLASPTPLLTRPSLAGGVAAARLIAERPARPVVNAGTLIASHAALAHAARPQAADAPRPRVAAPPTRADHSRPVLHVRRDPVTHRRRTSRHTAAAHPRGTAPQTQPPPAQPAPAQDTTPAEPPSDWSAWRRPPSVPPWAHRGTDPSAAAAQVPAHPTAPPAAARPFPTPPPNAGVPAAQASDPADHGLAANADRAQDPAAAAAAQADAVRDPDATR